MILAAYPWKTTDKCLPPAHLYHSIFAKFILRHRIRIYRALILRVMVDIDFFGIKAIFWDVVLYVIKRLLMPDIRRGK